MRIWPQINMARRSRKKSPRRRQAGIKLLNVLESYTYASILSQGIAGASPFGVLTGAGDIESYSAVDRNFLASGRMTTGGEIMGLRAGAQVVSLADIIQKPGDSLAVMTGNARNNLIPMAVQSFVFGFGFRLAKRMLRRPVNNINRNIMAPIFGKGSQGVAL